jgi:hypothetical protein
MSKKRDFLKSEQNRDKHPERDQAGSASAEESRGAARANVGMNPADKQAPHSGKLANDHNKQGNQKPTQKNEGRRTPRSRHDRQVFSGGPQNIIEARTGGKGGGRGPRGAG